MAAATEQIRVSEQVKRELERRRGEGESFNDVLERILDESDIGSFDDGFGRWSDETAGRAREARERYKEKSKRRMRRLSEDS